MLYHSRKHYIQLFENLSRLHQKQDENNTQFYRRIEECQANILASLNQTITDPLLLPGNMENINQITLCKFIYHCNPSLSTFLGWRGFSNINKGLAAAVQEETPLHLRANNLSFSKIGLIRFRRRSKNSKTNVSVVDWRQRKIKVFCLFLYGQFWTICDYSTKNWNTMGLRKMKKDMWKSLSIRL